MGRVLAWTAIVLGLVLALGAVALMLSAHRMFATGLSNGSIFRLGVTAILGLALLGQGRWLLRQASGSATR